MNSIISITGISALSAIGITSEEHWKSYQEPTPAMVWDEKLQTYIAPLTPNGTILISKIREERPQYNYLDDSVIYAIATARAALVQARWKESHFGINIGSSRGATQLFEKYYDAFKSRSITPTLASPSTTLGNISSWVAQDLKSEGPTISHSITCSTALHALLNGVAWLQSGMVLSLW